MMKSTTTYDLNYVYSRLADQIHKTPVLTSSSINSLYHGNYFFKCENFQKMGAFKMRGALNAVLNIPKEQLSHGVVTHSSGNFAQAIALAAQIAETKAHIVMPNNAPKAKVKAVKAYGGDITMCPPSITDRMKAAEKVIQETGGTFIHPSDQIEVILGNATVGMELLKEQPDLAKIYVPVGGGGLVAGTILAAQAIKPTCQIIGAEPLEVDDAYRSLKSGKIEFNNSTNTIADGLRTHLGDVNFPIIRNGISKIVRVTEEEIKSALIFVWQRMKIIIEPSSAVAVAAAIKENHKEDKIGVILSGGNIDFKSVLSFF